MKKINNDLSISLIDINYTNDFTLMCADVMFQYMGEYVAEASYYRNGTGYRWLTTEDLPDSLHNAITEEVEANEVAIQAFLEEQFQLEEAGEITNMQSI